MDDAFDAVLIYDGECPFCSIAATAIRQLDGIGIVAWDDEAAQTFLEKQFDEIPFALVLVDRVEQRVYVGRDAATELAQRAGMPGLVGSLIGERYDEMASAVQRTVGRGELPDDEHGIEPVRAGKSFEPLATAARRRPESLDG